MMPRELRTRRVDFGKLGAIDGSARKQDVGVNKTGRSAPNSRRRNPSASRFSSCDSCIFSDALQGITQRGHDTARARPWYNRPQRPWRRLL
jgi:hypothetical protein